MAKKYNSYKEVPKKYKWDLEDIIKGTSLDKLQKQYFDIFDQLISIKDSKYDSKEAYLEFANLQEKQSLIEFKIHNYLSNTQSINVVDPEINEKITAFYNKQNNYLVKYGSELNRMEANKDKLKTWKDLKEFKNLKLSIEDFLEGLEHKLSNEVEEYIQTVAKGDPSPEEIFDILDSSEVDFGYATSSNNKKYKITNGTRIILLKNKDEKVRKTTYQNYLLGYDKHRQSLAKLLLQHFKEISVDSKIRKYQSSVKALISGDHVDEKLLEIIYSNVKNNMHLFKKLSSAKKRFFKIKFNKPYRDWDTALDLIDVKTTYSVEETKEIFKQIISVMPARYKDVAIKAMDQNWVDFMNFPNKATGAYSIGASYGIDKKYILMNFDNTLGSVNTLCHEMGHSMHSYFSDITQPFNLSQYPIFLAEIASIFNELLLTDYLIENAKTDKEKFYFVSESISDFSGTVITQTLWSNYEYKLYKAMDEDQPLSSYEHLEKLYVETYNEYYSKIKPTKVGKKQNVYAVMVPHFYYYFYVYKYALGYIVANAFYRQYKEHGKAALENYIDKFLSAGCSMHPADILKNAGVDIYDSKVYQLAFENIASKIDLYIKLGNKIFKK